MPVVALTGMRQTGKSTFLRQQAELRGRRYVTLDDFAQLAAAKEDPEQFVAGGELAGGTSERPFLRRFFEEPSITGLGEVPPVPLDDVATGGMPPVCLGGLQDRAGWFKAYGQTYLERDTRDLGRIGDVIPFRGLLRLAALRTGGVLRISELGRDARLKAATVSGYLSVMETSCVFFC